MRQSCGGGGGFERYGVELMGARRYHTGNTWPSCMYVIYDHKLSIRSKTVKNFFLYVNSGQQRLTTVNTIKKNSKKWLETVIKYQNKN